MVRHRHKTIWTQGCPDSVSPGLQNGETQREREIFVFRVPKFELERYTGLAWQGWYCVSFWVSPGLLVGTLPLLYFISGVSEWLLMTWRCITAQRVGVTWLDRERERERGHWEEEQIDAIRVRIWNEIVHFQISFSEMIRGNLAKALVTM